MQRGVGETGVRSGARWDKRKAYEARPSEIQEAVSEVGEGAIIGENLPLC